MASLEYSIEAKNILTKFYRVDKMLYVEGDDDVPFWELMFEKFKSPNVEVQQVGGKEELRKYIDQINSGQLNAIVAMDRDFGPFDGSDTEHALVVRTAGYSIENTLINAKVLVKVARRIGRLPAKNATLEECQNWLEGFYNQCLGLLANDLIDQCEGAKVGVIGDNCDRFLESKQSDKVCLKKIEKYLKGLGLESDPALSKELEKLMADADLRLSDFIRGHFLASAAQRFVCLLVKRKRANINLSSAAFFGAVNLAFESTFGVDHPHFPHYQQEFERLRDAA